MRGDSPTINSSYRSSNFPDLPSALSKMLALESRRGFDNRAVIGGLEKALPYWMEFADYSRLDPSTAEEIASGLRSYNFMGHEDRERLVHSMLALLPEGMSSADGQPELIQPAVTHGHSSASYGQATLQTGVPAAPRSATSFSSARQDGALAAPLTVLQGVGPKTAATLAKLGVNTLYDLLYYFPRRYNDYSALKPIRDLRYGEELSVAGVVRSIQVRESRRSSVSIVEAAVDDGSAPLRVIWFNQRWLLRTLKPGMALILSGRVEIFTGRLALLNPEWEPLDKEHLSTGRIVPVYPLASGIRQRWLRKVMFDLVSFWAPRITDPLPPEIRVPANLIDLSKALQWIHFPETQQQLAQARRRLAFDEVLYIQLGVLSQRREWTAVETKAFQASEAWVRARLKRLPFGLTGAQERALAEIRRDLAQARPMNRMLQGDVGSGKTVVAGLAIAIVTSHGCQAALMAPTGILAQQHFQTLTAWLADPEDPSAVFKPGEIALLLGDTPEKESRRVLDGLAAGSIKLVVGTHALLEDPVRFRDLRLVVIDEQHRFGVHHRALLRAKGNAPHLLVMTATPIPRSLALTVYGDLDLTLMDEMPPGRIPVETRVLHPHQRASAYELIAKEVEAGHQAYIIYPVIEAGERTTLKSAKQEYALLHKTIFPEYHIGLLHGKMSQKEKDQVMLAFKEGRLQILVSTSVVEVGMDVPNATVMLIEGASRFGLAQLHQLRGRVGRGGERSFCILIPEDENQLENERLDIMTRTQNGFELAEKDLELRGPGEFLGTRQSGLPSMRLAAITDVHLIEEARGHALRLFEADPNLSEPSHEELKTAMTRYWQQDTIDIS